MHSENFYMLLPDWEEEQSCGEDTELGDGVTMNEFQLLLLTWLSGMLHNCSLCLSSSVKQR